MPSVNTFRSTRSTIPATSDLKIVRDNGTWSIEANYDDQAPLFAGIAVMVTFDKKVKLKGGGGE